MGDDVDRAIIGVPCHALDHVASATVGTTIHALDKHGSRHLPYFACPDAVHSTSVTERIDTDGPANTLSAIQIHADAESVVGIVVVAVEEPVVTIPVTIRVIMFDGDLAADIPDAAAAFRPVAPRLVRGSSQKKGRKGIALDLYAFSFCVGRDCLKFIGTSVDCVYDGHGGIVFHYALKGDIDHACGLNLFSFRILEGDIESRNDFAACSLFRSVDERLCFFLCHFAYFSHSPCGKDACCCMDLYYILAYCLLSGKLGHRREGDGNDLLSLCDLDVLCKLSRLVLCLESRSFSILFCSAGYGKCSDMRAFLGGCLNGDGLSDLVFYDKVKIAFCCNGVSVLISNGYGAVCGMRDSIGRFSICHSDGSACGADLHCYAAVLSLLSLFFYSNFQSRIFIERVFPGGGFCVNISSGICCYTILGYFIAFG